MASSKDRKDRREFWDGVVCAQRASGVSGRAWCQANGVALASFYHWRKKLSVAAAASAPAAHRSSDIQWLPLEAPKSAASFPTTPSGLTLRLGAVSVDIATGFDPRALSEVLHVLTRRAVEDLESRC